VDIAPGGSFSRHNHPGEETSMSSKARSFTKLDAKPPVTAKASQVLFIPAETVHAAKNVGSVNAAELGT